MNTKPTDVVSASEIAAWEWCPESWRLDALGNERLKKDEFARGEAFHARTAAVEVSSRRAAALARWILLVALVVVALCLLLLGLGEG